MKRTVYSTDQGRICPDCQNPVNTCQCSAQQRSQVMGDGKVVIRRETKGRKGKGVTLVSGLPLTTDQLKQLGKTLKQKCGVGGAVKEGTIEIQGDHRQLIQAELAKLGYKASISGG